MSLSQCRGRTRILATAFAAALFAVTAIATETQLAKAENDAARAAAIAAATAHADRRAEDVARDADRKPAKILNFFGIEPGMTVLDLNAGGGYYTELVSYVVGTDGAVYSHNDEIYWPFVEQGGGPAYGDRLENVTELRGVPAADIALEADSIDAAIMMLAYHDWYFTPEGRPEPADVPAALAQIKMVLKPGGVFGIVDHVAPKGSPPETGNSTHRIDPDFVRGQMDAAGFIFVDESDVLRNPDDPGTGSPFAEGMRGKTDRFVYLFRKPS